MPSSSAAATLSPSPQQTITMNPRQCAHALSTLYENAQHTLGMLFDNAHQNAFEFLMSKIRPFVLGARIEDIILLTPPTPSAIEPRATPLYTLFQLIYLFNTPPETGEHSAEFYIEKKEGPLEKIGPPGQNAIKQALFELHGLRYYLDSLDTFWNAEHEHIPCTNKEYMAQVFAAQLQCVNVLRVADHSFQLTSGMLISRLANTHSLSEAFLYRPSFRDESRDIDIPLIGAFIVSRHPIDHTHQENDCVLYLPGNSLQQFSSIASMAVHLATESYTHSLDRLSPCLFRQHHALLKNVGNPVMSEHNVRLTAIPFSQGFYDDQIQLLIDKQKDDLIYVWSRPNTIADTDWKSHFLRQSIDIRPFDFFWAGEKNHAMPILELWKEEERLLQKQTPIEPGVTPPTKPHPLTITVFIHNDLKDASSSSLYDDYFSWLVPELENLSNRSVNIHLVENGTVAELTGFDYTQGSVNDAINNWKTRVIEYLKKSAQAYSDLDKFLLLTRRTFGFDSSGGFVYGTADQIKGNFAIAATTKYRTAAHEIGHLLGATHEDGEIFYNGWWHESLMSARDYWSFLRGNAYRYSDKNRERIKSYLTQRP